MPRVLAPVPTYGPNMTNADLTTSRRALLSGALGLGGVAALAPAGSAGATPIPDDPSSFFFLKMAGVEGDADDERHAKEIELLTWGFGVVSSVDALGSTTGAAPGKSKPDPFTFVARTSKASPRLFELVATGKRVKQAVLTARRMGAQPVEYLTVTLREVRVTSYQVAPGEVDGFPLDVVRLEYAAIIHTVRSQAPDGSIGSVVSYGFDFAENRAIPL